MSKTKNVVIDDQNKKNENKQAIIKRMTDLMDTICGYYFKGRLTGCRPWVHERDEDGDGISIDLYNFGGDGKAVCDGLKPCTITYDDNSQESGHLFCMCYDPDPDEVTPLIFLFTPEDDEDCTMDIDPEDVSEETLQNILTWLEAEWASNSHEHKPSPKELTAIMDRWAGFCYNHPPYEEVILWMVGGSKQHYLYQHFCSKWLHLCENVCHNDTMATWIRFYRELDSKWAERLMEYVYYEWKKTTN